MARIRGARLAGGRPADGKSAAGRRAQLPRPEGGTGSRHHLRSDRPAQRLRALGGGLMQALVLAGGEGTRLRPLTYTVPKPVLPLAGRPHIAYVIDWLARHGVDDVIVSCGHLADGMRSILSSLELGVQIRFAEEPDARGTAGAIRFADEMLGDLFFVLNGDVLCDLDLTAQIEQ